MSSVKDLIESKHLWSRNDVLSHPCPIPKAPGVYAWFFREIPDGVPMDGCMTCGDLRLLYVGIAPKAPPSNGANPSSQRLFHRIRYHYRGNAEGSTLRLTLGCLLSESLGITLRRVGSGNRLTFADGENRLSLWMQENAFVTWAVCEKPWLIEEELIKQLSLPLNLDKNRDHPFCITLSAIRSHSRERARSLPIVH
ncbi:MAG: GIY-YIG nuclease family protein [Syntrophobacteraceae bacterium]